VHRARALMLADEAAAALATEYIGAHHARGNRH